MGVMGWRWALGVVGVLRRWDKFGHSLQRTQDAAGGGLWERSGQMTSNDAIQGLLVILVVEFAVEDLPRTGNMVCFFLARSCLGASWSREDGVWVVIAMTGPVTPQSI